MIMSIVEISFYFTEEFFYRFNYVNNRTTYNIKSTGEGDILLISWKGFPKRKQIKLVIA